MPTVTAPLLSFGASGQIAKTQVYAQWKGIPYARRYVIPANPRSTDQTLTRQAFKFLQAVYQLMPSEGRLPWQAFVKGKPLIDRNAWTSKNLPVIRSEDDLSGLILSPGALGGLPASVVYTETDTTITATLTVPDSLPAGWTVVGSTAIAVQNVDAQSSTIYDSYVGTDDTSPYAPVIDGLTASTEYAVGSWLIYQRSSVATDLAYGPSTAALITTSA